MEQILIHLLAEMNAMEERTKAKVDANLKMLEAEMETNQEKMTAMLKAKIEAKTDSHHGRMRSFEILFSWMDTHQARTESTQEEMRTKMDMHQKKMEAAIHSLQSKLKETIKHLVEDVLSCVDQKAQGLHKELSEKIDETQVDLQAIKTSIDMQTRTLPETITNTREHLHEELQVETQIMKALTKAT
jgi:predicted  nucleic acid-binding Zn-ribbon protein